MATKEEKEKQKEIEEKESTLVGNTTVDLVDVVSMSSRRNIAMGKIREPEVFNGSQDVELWTEKMERYMKLTQIEEEIQLDFAESYLDGLAESCWRFHKKKNEVGEWKDLKEVLVKRFQTKDIKKLRQEFLNIRCGFNIEEYNNKFVNLFMTIGDITEEDAIVRYITGLKPNTATMVEVQDPKDLEEAMRLAVVFEKKFQIQATRNRDFKRTTTNFQNTNNNVNNIKLTHNPQKQNTHTSFKPSSSNFSHSSQPHSRSFVGSNSGSTSRNSDKPKVTCFKCGEEGHIKRDCQNKVMVIDHNASEELLTVNGNYEGQKVKILIDSGSTINVISDKIAQAIDDKEEEAIVANGGKMSIKGDTRGKLSFEGSIHLINAKIAEITKFDVILGKPWLSEVNPKINYRTNLVSFKQKGKEVKFLARANLISAQQLKKSVSKGAEPFVAFVFGKEDKDVAVETNSTLQNLLDEYKDLFPDELPGMPPKREYEFEIKLDQEIPVPPKRPYRLNFREEEELKKQIDELLGLGLIQPSRSPFASPVLFVKKHDGSLRLCVDYRALNKATIKNKYPVPRSDDCVDNVAGYQFYSACDCRSGYYQMGIKPEDIQKTAFVTKFGLYEFKVVCFGLTNAPSAFSEMLRKIFEKEIGKILEIYIDDIVIFSNTIEDHLRHLRIFFDKLREHKIYLKRSKCSFLKQQVKFLGHIVSAEGINPDPDKVSVIKAWKEPTNVKELQSFLGLMNYYRKFIPNFAAISVPLTNLLKNDVVWKWNEKEKFAFEELKVKLIECATLKKPDFDKPFTITCDASDYSMGAVLSQEGYPIAFYSRKFNKTESNYSTYEKETLAILNAVRTWKHYLNDKVLIESDHMPLKYLKSQKNPTPKQMRWIEELEELDYEIVHKKGKENPVADALSRIYSIRIDDDEKKREIIEECHSSDVAGHFGVAKTLEQIKRRFDWEGVSKDVENFVKSCDVCQKSKNVNTKAAGLLQPIPVPKYRWEQVSMDLLTHLPKTDNGNDTLVVFVDKLTKMIKIAPTTINATAADIADIFLDNIFRNFGLPDSIISDRDTRFNSNFWRRLMETLNVKVNMTTARHPQADGQTERTNRSLLDIIRGLKNKENWDKMIPIIEFSYNNAKNASTGFTPFFLYSGRHPKTPIDLREKTNLELLDIKLEDIDNTIEVARRNIEASQKKQKTYYDEKRADKEFEEGEMVLVSHKFVQPHNKTDPRFYGPFKIVKKISSLVYELDFGKSKRNRTVNIEFLKNYHASDNTVIQPLPLDEEDNQWEVEKLLGEKSINGIKHYLVQWKGFTQEHNTWIPAKDIHIDLRRNYKLKET
jgi:hypothetical protein